MAKKNFFIVKEEEIDQRLDKFLFKKIKNITYPKVQKMIRKGYFKVNLEKKKPNYKIESKDKIYYSQSFEPEEKRVIDYRHIYKKEIEDIKKNIVFQDQNILVFNKPHGISVQGGSKIRFNIDAVLKYMSIENDHLRLVHRIDKDTSGLLLIAKSKHIAKEISKKFKDNAVNKIYLSLCHGIPKIKQGTISHSLVKSKIKGREIMIIDKESKKKAITFYKLLESRNGLSLLKIIPKTGRTHQIRAHLKSCKIAILGDKKYATEEATGFYKRSNSIKMHLHSFKLDFILENKKYYFKANLPKHFLETLKKNKFDTKDYD